MAVWARVTDIPAPVPRKMISIHFILYIEGVRNGDFTGAGELGGGGLFLPSGEAGFQGALA